MKEEIRILLAVLKEPDATAVTKALSEAYKNWRLEMLKRGAINYVRKDHLFRIAPAITRALSEVQKNMEQSDVDKPDMGFQEN